MTLTFDRPVGAPADVAELEYVATLHQTGPEVREDCSVTDEDIALFLTSRYGIRMTKEQVSEHILTSLGHGSGTKADTCLDLVQLVSLLLIPKLRREQQNEAEPATAEESSSSKDEKPPLIPYVLNTLLHDVNDKTDSVDLTTDFLKDLFLLYGESELALDEGLLQCMIDQVAEIDTTTHDVGRDTLLEGDSEDEDGDETGHVSVRRVTPKLTAAVFTKLLTDDIQLFDLGNESRLSTNFDDVFKESHQNLGRKAKQPVNIIYFESRRGLHTRNDDEGHDEEIAGRRCKKRNKVPLPTPRYFTSPDESPTQNDAGEEITIPISPAANCLDFAADTFRSGFLVVALWTSFAISYFTYYWGWNWQDHLLPSCDSYEVGVRMWYQKGTFFCQLGHSILRWIYVVLTMSIYGLTYFGVAGIGNNIENRNPLLPLLGAIVAGLLTALPAFLFESLSQRVPTQFLKYVSIFLGVLVVVMNVVHFIDLAAPRWLRKRRWWQEFFTPQGVRAEASVKQAASYKVGNMIDNARDVQSRRRNDGVIETYFGQALFNFSEDGEKTDRVDGFYYTWRSIMSHSLFKQEGVWFSGRLLSINITQFIVVVFVLLLGLVVTVIIVDDYDAESKQAEAFLNDIIERGIPDETLEEFQDALLDHLSSLFLTNGVGLLAANCTLPFFTNVDFATDCDNALELAFRTQSREDFLNGCVHGDDALCTLFHYNGDHIARGTEPNRLVQELLLEEVTGTDLQQLLKDMEDYLTDAATQPVDDLYPQEKYMIFIPCLFGTLAAFIAAWSHAVTILPSATTSILKLRSGLLPFLRDPKLKTMRIAPDQVAYLQGAAFWGILLSSLLFAGLVGGLIFVFLWQVTYHIAFRLLTGFLGALVVVLIHWMLVRSCRFNTSQAYYRFRPAAANIILLARECAFFALTVFYVIVRACKLIFTTLLYLGRIDTPILADGVGEFEMVGYRLDGIPYIFLMDILLHEAHRHPYIETLGVMYMMKLKHGESFGSRVGSAWRLLFVLTLMPWLWKYRKMARPDLLLPEELDEAADEPAGEAGGSSSVRRSLSLQPGVTTFTRRSTLAGFGGLMLGRQSTSANREGSEADALRWKMREQKQESAEKEELLRLEVRHLQEQLDAVQAANLAPQPARPSLSPPPRSLASERYQPAEFRSRTVSVTAPDSEDDMAGRRGEPVMLSDRARKGSYGLPQQSTNSRS